MEEKKEGVMEMVEVDGVDRVGVVNTVVYECWIDLVVK